MIPHIGQKVVCLDNRLRGGGVYARETLPKVGSVYTIRAIVPCKVYGYDEDGLLLVEVVNSERQYLSPRGPITHELAFRITRFRPVRTTSIDAFRKMLEPLKVREPTELT